MERVVLIADIESCNNWLKYMLAKFGIDCNYFAPILVVHKWL